MKRKNKPFGKDILDHSVTGGYQLSPSLSNRLKSASTLMPVKQIVNVPVEGEGMVDIFLHYYSPEIAYAVCLVALSKLRTEIKNKGVAMDVLNEVKSQVAALADPEGFKKRLDSLSKNFYDKNDSVNKAGLNYYHTIESDTLKNENVELKAQVRILESENKQLKSDLSKTEMNLRGEKEKYANLKVLRDKDVSKLSKEVLALEHRLIEMEKANQFPSFE